MSRCAQQSTHFTDPSGYFFKWVAKKIKREVVEPIKDGLSSANCKIRQSLRDAEDYVKDKWTQIRRVAVTAIAYTACGGICAAAVYSGRRARDHGARGSAVWKAAAIGGITAALFAGAGNIYADATNASTHWATKFAIKAGLHGAIGCASAKASGGSCRDGAIAAGLAGGFNAATNGGLAFIQES